MKKNSSSSIEIQSNTDTETYTSASSSNKKPAKSNKSSFDANDSRFSGQGLRLELFMGYLPAYAGSLGFNFGYKFKNKNDHFALGLYGQIAYGFGLGYSLYPAFVSLDVNAILKFHIIKGNFVFSPFIGGGIGADGMVIFIFPVGAIYYNLRTGLSFDWHVRKRSFIGFDLGIVEAFSSALYMSSDYFNNHCHESDSGVCNSLFPWPSVPQAYLSLHFGFYFRTDRKNKLKK